MIHLLVGNTGAGKSSYANTLKHKVNGFVFTIDKWNNILFLKDKTESDGLEWFLERIHRAEFLMQDLILQLENLQIDSILDLGFSKFAHREKFRKFAIDNDVKIQTHFLNIEKNTRKERILKRNLEQGETFEFEVTEADFEFMETWFETPTKEELQNAIIRYK